MTFIASPGKGTGAGGSIIFQTAPAGSTGTAVNAPVTALTLNSAQTAIFGGGINNTHLSTGTNADFVCLAAGGAFLIQSSACTISSMRFKNLIGGYRVGGALGTVARLKPIVFEMKEPEEPFADWGRHENPDRNYANPQIGLSAENVAAIEPRCAIYEDDGITPKSYRQECLIALLIAANQEQQRHILWLWLAVGLLALLQTAAIVTRKFKTDMTP